MIGDSALSRQETSAYDLANASSEEHRGAREVLFEFAAYCIITCNVHILVVLLLQFILCQCLWLHDCMLYIILQALNILRELHRGFCMIVLHLSDATLHSYIARPNIQHA